MSKVQAHPSTWQLTRQAMRAVTNRRQQERREDNYQRAGFLAMTFSRVELDLLFKHGMLSERDRQVIELMTKNLAVTRKGGTGR